MVGSRVPLLHHRTGRCCVCTLTLTVQDRPRHPHRFSWRSAYEETLSPARFMQVESLSLSYLHAGQIFLPLRTPMWHLCDLSIMILRARVNALIVLTRCNFAAYIIRISKSVAELIGPTRSRQERMLKP